MSNWFLKSIAFFLLALSISFITFSVFISDANDSLADAQAVAREKNDVLSRAAVQTQIDAFVSQNALQIKTIEAVSIPLRQQLLSPQCATVNISQQPFCHPDFISGKQTITEVLAVVITKSIDVQYDEATDTALFQANQKLSTYLQYPLFLLGIIAGISSFLLYFYLGRIAGIQSALGNLSWLALLSAISYKMMPSLLSKLIPVAAQGIQDPQLTVVMLDIVVSWLQPALQHAFVISIIFAIVGFVAWLALKFVRNYDVSVE